MEELELLKEENKELKEAIELFSKICVREDHGILIEENWFAEFESEYYILDKILNKYFEK